jgi:hypothetical protein
MNDLISILKDLATQVKQMKTEIVKLTEAVSDLQSSRNIEPIMIDDAPKQERQIPYKVVQYVEDTESV